MGYCSANILAEVLREVYNDGNSNGVSYSDMKLEYDGELFPLHRVVVCEQSPVIKKALEDDTKKSDSRIYTIRQDFSILSVKCLIEYLYKGKYHICTALYHTGTGGDTRKAELIGHMHVFELAKLLEIPPVSKLAFANMEHFFQINSPAGIFPDVVTDVLNRTKDGPLIDFLVRIAADHYEELVKDDALSCLLDKPDFMRKLFHQLNGRIVNMEECIGKLDPKWRKENPCRKCGFTSSPKGIIVEKTHTPTGRMYVLKCGCGNDYAFSNVDICV